MANENIRPGEGGTGSAENQGRDREDQRAKNTTVSEDEKQNIADQTGLKPEDITDVQETGGLSGRGDAAGGSGDDMTTTSTNDKTRTF